MNDFKIDTDLVEALKVKRQAALAVLREIDERSTPVFSDPHYSLLPEIYAMFLEMYAGRSVCCTSVYERKKFLFVCLCLYSPRTLYGAKIRTGLRDRMLGMLGCTSRTSISDNCRNIMRMYCVYRDFRADTNALLRQIRAKWTDRFPQDSGDHVVIL